jgi:hypothetical protein
MLLKRLFCSLRRFLSSLILSRSRNEYLIRSKARPKASLSDHFGYMELVFLSQWPQEMHLSILINVQPREKLLKRGFQVGNDVDEDRKLKASKAT